MATFRPATLEYIATTAGLHACSEAVNTGAAADFGLVGSLWHITLFTSIQNNRNHSAMSSYE
jgi:hypothetical protein